MKFHFVHWTKIHSYVQFSFNVSRRFAGVQLGIAGHLWDFYIDFSPEA